MIYLDNASTTPMLPNVYQAVLPWMSGEKFGNPSSLHKAGCAAREAVETARQHVADLIHAANKDEIIFTSGGTESNNLALQGISQNRVKSALLILTSSIEHHAILNQADAIKKDYGLFMKQIPVGKDGVVDLVWLEEMLQQFGSTIRLVSVMLVNNETGVIQPIGEIAKLCHKHHILLHTDAVQAVGHIYVDVQDLDVDLLSLSGHKFGAPDGIGALYVRESVLPELFPLLHGGGQEFGKRAGTENVAGIVGLGEVARSVSALIPRHMMKYYWCGQLFLEGVRNGFLGELEEHRVRVNCKDVATVGNILSLTVSGVEAESLLLLMDADGVCISAASACTAGSLEPSHVLKAMGMSDEEAHSTVRISFGECNTEDEVVKAGRIFAKNVNRIRAMYGGYN